MQPDEMFDDRLRIRGVHRERFARPVDAGTHATDLAADRAGRKFFPFPDFFDELLAAEVETCRLAGQLEIALDERSEAHTSELQYLLRTSYAVFCLKKKKKH